MIDVGARVFLRACRHGEPGTAIRRERGRVAVFWPDMDFVSRHKEDSLELALPVRARTTFEGEADARAE